MKATASFEPIGILSSCYKERFGTPRQPGLVKAATGTIRLVGRKWQDATKGLETFSHIWIIFIFHEIKTYSDELLTIRPPRLAQSKKNRRIGVLASRTPHRPNPIGLSAVKLEKIEHDKTGTTVTISGVDIVDGAPVLDIKPYLAYSDSIPRATLGWTDGLKMPSLKVRFAKNLKLAAETRALIRQTLELDPRPISQVHRKDAMYGAKIDRYDVQWTIQDGSCVVTGLIPL